MKARKYMVSREREIHCSENDFFRGDGFQAGFRYMAKKQIQPISFVTTYKIFCNILANFISISILIKLIKVLKIIFISKSFLYEGTMLGTTHAWHKTELATLPKIQSEYQSNVSTW